MKIHFKTFKCEICDEEFEKKPDFTKHMKSHKVEGAVSYTHLDVYKRQIL